MNIDVGNASDKRSFGICVTRAQSLTIVPFHIHSKKVVLLLQKFKTTDHVISLV